MAEEYTGINVLKAQHADLKRIAQFKGITITDLGVEIADQFIKGFKAQNSEVMDEFAALEKRMTELRSQIAEKDE